MEPFTLFATIIVFFLTFLPFVKWLLKRIKLIRIIDRIPGPKAYPIIGTAWEFFGMSRYDVFYIHDKRIRQYPEIVRIWNGMTPEVRIAKPEYVERIISSMQNIEKGLSYVFVRPWLGNGLLTSKDQRWHKHRKIITPTFHFKILNSFCEVFAEKTDILVKRLEKYAEINEIVDIYPFITKAALDIICQTAMGVTINAQTDVENEYVRAVYDISELIVQRIIRPWYHYEFIFKHSELYKKSEETLSVLHNFTRTVIQERKISRQQNLLANEGATTASDVALADKDESEFITKKRLAFLDLLLEGNTNDNNLTDDDIREEVDTFMFEGHDTTTAGISWALLLIGLHDDVQAKIAQECDEIFGDSDRSATIHDLNDMKYLERVIKETLRLYPSVASMGRKLSEDVQLGPYMVPKDTAIAIQIYHVHRDPVYFPDPEKFDPDRFLPDAALNRHPYAYVPFSAGPRNCIGQKFAILEEKSLISGILRKYKIKSIDKREDVILWHELILRPKNGVRILLEKRKHAV